MPRGRGEDLGESVTPCQSAFHAWRWHLGSFRLASSHFMPVVAFELGFAGMPGRSHNLVWKASHWPAQACHACMGIVMPLECLRSDDVTLPSHVTSLCHLGPFPKALKERVHTDMQAV